MKFKLLLLGTNMAAIDDFFKQMENEFELLTTSMRFTDIRGHVKYFHPDAIVYCMHHEQRKSILSFMSSKNETNSNNIPYIIIGDRQDCDECMKIAVNVVDLQLVKPIAAITIADEIGSFLRKKYRSENMSEALEAVIAPQQPQQIKLEVQPQQYTPTVSNINSVLDDLDSLFGTTSQRYDVPAQPAEPENGMQGEEPVVVATADMPAMDPMAGMQTMDPMAGMQTVNPMAGVQTVNPMAGMPSVEPAADPMAAVMSDPTMAGMLGAVVQRPRKRAELLPGEKLHILIVDDDVRLLKMLKRHLEDFYQVATAPSGKVALHFLATRTTDLILLDYMMPEMDGPQVLEEIRKLPTMGEIPVVFLTGAAEKSKIQKALSMKPQGYLLKPVDRIKLFKKIDSIFDA